VKPILYLIGWLHRLFDGRGDGTDVSESRIIFKGVVGLAGASTPAVMSWYELIKTSIGMAASLCGLLISILTVWSLWLTVQRKRRIEEVERRTGTLSVKPDESKV
jgi:membrane associated rhomboid family serine protease